MSFADRFPPEQKALGDYINEALTTLHQSVDEGSRRNAAAALADANLSV